jgi:hypothetical protein
VWVGPGRLPNALAGGTGRTSASLPVPYAGNGSYTVTITAYGYDESGRADRLGSDQSGAGKRSEKTDEGELEAVEPPAEAQTTTTPATRSDPCPEPEPQPEVEQVPKPAPPPE